MVLHSPELNCTALISLDDGPFYKYLSHLQCFLIICSVLFCSVLECTLSH